MQLTLYTDYSLRTLIYLHISENKLSTISEIADYYGISKNHLVKVVHNLSQEGFIHSVRGKGGGLRLAIPGEKIIVGDVVRKTEPNFHIVECFDNEKVNECIVPPVCRLKTILERATEEFLLVLDQFTIDDMLTGKPEWSPIKLVK